MGPHGCGKNDPCVDRAPHRVPRPSRAFNAATEQSSKGVLDGITYSPGSIPDTRVHRVQADGGIRTSSPVAVTDAFMDALRPAGSTICQLRTGLATGRLSAPRNDRIVRAAHRRLHDLHRSHQSGRQSRPRSLDRGVKPRPPATCRSTRPRIIRGMCSQRRGERIHASIAICDRRLPRRLRDGTRLVSAVDGGLRLRIATIRSGPRAAGSAPIS